MAQSVALCLVCPSPQSIWREVTVRFVDGQTIGQLTGELVDRQTMGQLSTQWRIRRRTDNRVDNLAGNLGQPHEKSAAAIVVVPPTTRILS